MIDCNLGPDGPCGGPEETFLTLMKGNCHKGTDPAFLMAMCDDMVVNVDECSLPELYYCIGYVQGCLTYGGILTIENVTMSLRNIDKCI